MANRHKELWNVVDIVAKDYFGEWKQFESEYARPISLSRSASFVCIYSVLLKHAWILTINSHA